MMACLLLLVISMLLIFIICDVVVVNDVAFICDIAVVVTVHAFDNIGLGFLPNLLYVLIRHLF